MVRRYVVLCIVLLFCVLGRSQSDTAVECRAFGAHFELSITYPDNISSCKIDVRTESTGWVTIRSVNQDQNFIHYVETAIRNETHDFRVIWNTSQPALRDTISLNGKELILQSDEDLIDMVQEYTFRYFWDFGHPNSGMARERNTSGNLVTSGGSGFGIMAILVGIERGWITREEGFERLKKIVGFLETTDRFYGAYPHWINGNTGRVIPFSQFDDGGDLVETAFLMQGLLTAREYFDRESNEEESLRFRITQIWEGVNWNWYRKSTEKVLYWHWSPNHAWRMNLPIRGYNEALIIYLLAVASPTHPVPPTLYQQGWAGGSYTNGGTYYDIQLPLGPRQSMGGPLFFAHYSFLGFDPRGIRDEYANYFEQNRNHTLINRAYCIDNPKDHEGYSDVSWGLTASDDPFGYLAHEPNTDRDNGTITPTAAASSIIYTPEESIAAMRHFYEDLGDRLWGPYGFYDAFNLNEGWFASSYLAIDQGPIVCMIENYRTELLWDYFMRNDEVTDAIAAIGFVEDTTTVGVFEPIAISPLAVFPNPVGSTLKIEFDQNDIPDSGDMVEIISAQGQVVSRHVLSGSQIERIGTSSLTPGIYGARTLIKGKLFFASFVVAHY